jgi:hypothetical protein
VEISKWTNTWNRLLYGWDLNQIGETLIVAPDFSHWSVNANLKIDEAKLKKQIIDKKVKAIIYKGTDFDRNKKQMFTDSSASFWWGIGEKYGLLRGSYHWLQYDVDPTVAFNYHDKYIQEYPTELPYIVDFEEKSVSDFSDYIWRLEVWTGLAEKKLANDLPVIYIGGWYLDIIRNKIGIQDYNKKMSKFARYPAWFALYSRYSPKKYCEISKKNIFYPWESDGWVMWQYSDVADFPYYKDNDEYYGESWGIPSAGLDMNLIKTSWLQKYLDKYNHVDPIEAVKENEIYYISKYDMKIRKGAGSQYEVNRIAKKGEKFKLLDVSGNSAWIKIEDGWVCKSLNGFDYLERE